MPDTPTPTPRPTGNSYSTAAAGGTAASGEFAWSDTDAALWGIQRPGAISNVQYGRQNVTQPLIGPVIPRQGPGAFNEQNRPQVKVGENLLTAPVGQILQKLASSSPADLGKLQLALRRGGFIGPKTAFDPGQPDSVTVEAFTKLLQVTARLTAQGKDKTWQEVLDESINPGSDLAAVLGSLGAGPTTSTTKSVNLTDPESGKAVIMSAFKASVGRDATASEIDKFIAHLNSAEKASPTITTTRTDASGNSASQTTTGGIGAAGVSQMAEDSAKANPDYANYQAAAFYMPLLFQSLGATTGLEGGID